MSKTPWPCARVARLAFAALVACQPREPDSPARASRTAEPSAQTPRVAPAARAVAIDSRVLRVGFTVSDLDRAVRAFEQLDFRRVSRTEPPSESLSALYALPNARARVVELALGNENLELTQCLTNQGRATPSDSRSNDASFQHIAIVVSDMDAAYARVFEPRSGTTVPQFWHVSPAPQTIPLSNPAAGGIRALYFRDTDRHNLELIWFPPGKGRPIWHVPRSGLFVGIDHTAIAVADGERGRGPYAALGFTVAGASLNFGVEQEALSGVPGARVAITALRNAGGPGVEFLSYLAPRDGRPALADSTPCDLWHWEITIAVPALEAALAALTPLQVTQSSSAIAEFPEGMLGYRRAILVRDPDGHALRLVER
jgi:catechol 2,3-dioxygenase-like lactoylglutathione lyase family enzyme